MAPLPKRLISKALLVGTVAGAIAAWLRGRQRSAFEPWSAEPRASEPRSAEPHVTYSELTPEVTDAAAADNTPLWIHPVDGRCPEGHPIKARFSTGHYHRPDDPGYSKVVPDSCYATEADAEADGFSGTR